MSTKRTLALALALGFLAALAAAQEPEGSWIRAWKTDTFGETNPDSYPLVETTAARTYTLRYGAGYRRLVVGGKQGATFRYGIGEDGFAQEVHLHHDGVCNVHSRLHLAEHTTAIESGFWYVELAVVPPGIEDLDGFIESNCTWPAGRQILDHDSAHEARDVGEALPVLREHIVIGGNVDGRPILGPATWHYLTDSGEIVLHGFGSALRLRASHCEDGRFLVVVRQHRPVPWPKSWRIALTVFETRGAYETKFLTDRSRVTIPCGERVFSF